MCARKISNPGDSDDVRHLELLLEHEDLLIRQSAK